MNPWLLVALGGALGSMGRYGVSLLLKPVTLSSGFPLHTLTVNLIGGFLMGALVGSLARFGESHESLHLLLAVGVLGGFTTFSAFSLDAVLLLQRGQWASAAVYIGLSLLGSIGALILALKIFKEVA